MRARSLFILASIGSLFGTAGAASAEPLRLKPSTGWQLREYDDKCRITRTFGKGENALTLWVDKGGPGPGVNLTLIGRPVRSPYGATIRVGFAPGEPVDRNFITATSSQGRPVLGMFGVQPVSQVADLGPDAATPPQTGGEESVDLTLGTAAGYVSNDAYKQRLAAITALELSGAVIDPIVLELDEALPMADDLWNCSKALSERLAQNFGALGGKGVQPVDIAIWAQKIQENYPAHLLRAEQQGTVAVRLTITKDGKPTFCEVTGYSGPASFNDTACLQLLRHAKFAPATDAAGNPVASFYSTRITYRLNK